MEVGFQKESFEGLDSIEPFVPRLSGRTTEVVARVEPKHERLRFGEHSNWIESLVLSKASALPTPYMAVSGTYGFVLLSDFATVL